MPLKRRLKVIRVPLENKQDVIMPNFPIMPRLYAELLENKNKVKVELRNVEHTPVGLDKLLEPQIDIIKDPVSSSVENKKDVESSTILRENDNDRKSRQKSRSLRVIDLEKLSGIGTINKLPHSSKESFTPDVNLNKSSENDDVLGVYSNDKNDSSYNRDDRRDRDRDDRRDRDRDDRRDRDRDDRRDRDRDYDRRDRDYDRRDRDYDRRDRDDRRDDRDYDDEGKNDRDERRDESNLIETRGDKREKLRSSDGLSKLLRGDATGTETNSVSSSLQTQQSVKPAQNLQDVQKPAALPGVMIPPSITEINSGKAIVDGNGIRNMAYTTRAEDEELTRKMELLRNFDKIRKIHPTAKIKEYSEFTDIKTLERDYSYILKDLEINSTVENYKQYLIMGFKLLEIFLIHYMDFKDIEGFSQDQAIKINQYEKVLMEIGEKNYISDNKKWPPELRLLGIILFQTFSFVGFRYIGSMFGKSTKTSFQPQQNKNYSPNDPSVQPTFSNVSFESSGPKKKMKGPDFNFDDFEKKNS
jgi:hypothetical protein